MVRVISDILPSLDLVQWRPALRMLHLRDSNRFYRSHDREIIEVTLSVIVSKRYLFCIKSNIVQPYVVNKPFEPRTITIVVVGTDVEIVF